MYDKSSGKNGEESFKIRDALDAGGQHVFLNIGSQKTIEKDIPLIGIVSRDFRLGTLPNDAPNFSRTQRVKTTSREFPGGHKRFVLRSPAS